MKIRLPSDLIIAGASLLVAAFPAVAQNPAPSLPPVPPFLAPPSSGTPPSSARAPVPVPPPPHPAVELPPPPIPPRVQLTFPRTALERQRVTPTIEVWRAGAPLPQVPVRHGRYMTPAFIADNQPVMVRLQFDPLARGKTIVVRPGKGAILDPPTEVLQIRPTGECVVTVRLEENATRGHLSFHCDGLMTTLPLSRSSLAAAQAAENARAGGGR